MSRRDWMRCTLLVPVLALVAGVAPLAAQQLGAQNLPVDAYKKNDRGILVVEVTYGSDGKVVSCHILRSNVPQPLEAATVDTIKRKWVDEGFAGQTLDLPITFDELPWYATHWDEGFVPPPNTLPKGDPGRSLKLRLTFGADGWIELVQIAQSSGIGLVDRQAAVWAKVHWHNDAFAGQTVDAPLQFEAPITAKPAVASTPAPAPKPKPKPVAPAEEPAAPAVRVQ